MRAAKQRFLKPELLTSIASMELRVATVVEGVMTGLHRSPFRGLSIEFAEYRRYMPGDEPKRIDWKVLARCDKYYIKEYEDETNLDAHLILDASASMNFGTGAMTKWQYGATLAASLAYVLQGQKDNIGLAVLDEETRVEMESKNTRGHLINLIGELEKTEPARGTRLPEALHQVAIRVKRKGLIVVVSDLLDDPERVMSALRHLQFGGNDIVVFQTLDPAELRFEYEGPAHFVDPETKALTPALAEEVRDSYLEAMRGFLDYYREEMGKTNIHYTLLDISEPLDRAILAFLGGGMK